MAQARFVVNSGATSNYTSESFENLSTTNNGGAGYVSPGGTLSATSCTFNSNSADYGGAIFNSGTAVINDGSFANNSATTNGGAIYNKESATIIGTKFSGNNAKSLGGAIFNSKTAKITSGSFANNSATYGGAIYNKGTAIISATEFNGNSTISFGGAIYNSVGGITEIYGGSFSSNNATSHGGAIFNKGSATISGTTLNGNTASANGGAIYENGQTLTLSSATFTGNTANRGGAIYIVKSATIDKTVFSGNVAFSKYDEEAQRTEASGGAIHCQSSGVNITITNCQFNNNESGEAVMSSGGALYIGGTITVENSSFTNNKAATRGGALFSYKNTVTLNNVTFTGNTTETGCGGAISIGDWENHSGTLNLNGVTFDGNSAKSGGAVYNVGTINIQGTVDLQTQTDTWVNTGISSDLKAVVNWDLTDVTDPAKNTVCIKNFQYYSNNEHVTQTITVNATKSQQVAGSYTIATNVGTISAEAYNNTFTLVTKDDTTGKSITVDGEAVDYNGLRYTLAQSNNNLILTARADDARIVVNGGETKTLGKESERTTYITEPYTGDGGAVSIEQNGTFSATNVDFDSNSATSNGGAIFNSGTAVINNGSFANNSATSKGGAIYNAGNVNAEGITFTNNKADYAGAVYNKGTMNLTGSGNMFSGNSTADDHRGGGLWNNEGSFEAENISFTNNKAGFGGAVYNEGTGASVTIKGTSLFSGNHSVYNEGGAFYNDASATFEGVTFTENKAEKGYGGAIFDNDTSTKLEITSATFSKNEARRGGAIYTEGKNPSTISNTTFTENVAFAFVEETTNDEEEKTKSSGGAIHVSSKSTLTVKNCEFTKNESQEADLSQGGAIYTGGTLTISDTTFTENKASIRGGALYTYGGTGVLTPNETTLTNVIFKSNTAAYGGAVANGGGVLNLNNVTFNGNSASIYGGAIANAGTVNISGTVTLSTENDTWANARNEEYLLGDAVVNWDLTAVTDPAKNTVCINNFQYVVNNENVSQTITVNPNDKNGVSYVIATGDFTTVTNKNTFTLTGVTGQDDKVITINGDTVIYNNLNYRLVVDDNGTATTTNDDKLVLMTATSDTAFITVSGVKTEDRDLVSYNGIYWIQGKESITFTVESNATKDKTYDVSGTAESEVTGAAWPTDGWKFHTDTTKTSGNGIITIHGKDDFGMAAADVTVTYQVDSIAPTVQPVYISTVVTDLLTVSATFEDADSGVNIMQYSLDGGESWNTYSGSISVRKSDFKNGKGEAITPTIHFKGIDRAGNEGSAEADLSAILVETIINAETDTTTLTKEATLKVTLSQGSSAVDNKYSWSKDGGQTWFNETIDTEQKITENGTYSIRVIDSTDKVWTKDVTFTNIEVQPEGKTTVDPIALDGSKNGNPTEEFKVASEVNASDLSIANGTLTVQKDASLKADTLKLSGKASLAIAKVGTGEEAGTAAFETLNVSGKENSLDESIDFAKTETRFATVEQEAELTLNKDQYDDLMDIRQFSSVGTLNVETATGNGLDQNDIQKLIDINTVRSVQFEDKLENIQKLTFGDNGSLDIGFNGASGVSNKATTLTFAKNSNVKFGKDDTAINLNAGNNKIDIKANANVDIRSDVKDVSTVKVANGSTVKVTDANGKSAKQQMYTIVELADVNFSAERSGTLSIGKFNEMSVGNVAGQTAKSNKVSIGANSQVKIESISEVSNLNVSAGSQYKALSTDTSKTRGITTVQVGDFTGSNARADKITTGSFSDVTFKSINFKTDATASSSKNSISVGGKAVFTVTDVISDVSGLLNTSIYGVNSLKAGNGSYDKKTTTTTLTNVSVAGDIKGTEGNDTIQFGNYNYVTLGGTVDLGKGKDTFKVGNYSYVEVGAVNLGTGKDTFKVGNDSEVHVGNISADVLSMSIGSRSVVTTGDISGLNKLTIDKNSTFVAQNIALDAEKNTVSISDKATFNVASLDLAGGGSNTFSLGKGASANIAGKTSFSPNGKNQVTVGNGATLVMKSETSNVAFKSFTLGTNAKAYLSHELVEKVTKAPHADVYDIGSYEVAACFTNIDNENSDNDLADAIGLDLGTYNGWLSNVNGCVDLKDFVKVGDAKTLDCTGVGENVHITLWNDEGSTEITEHTGVISLAGYTDISFELSESAESKAAIKYTYMLA